ncbi:hypothetical protein EMIHUDRAFT_458515, partial [Emiliania huxleyi CCMP1516]|uniref:Uncharacterized protein n=2 Tax=Emiliania huxleyi TaxID=2903 RepID=A0A0D3JB87_EMIH1
MCRGRRRQGARQGAAPLLPRRRPLRARPHQGGAGAAAAPVSRQERTHLLAQERDAAQVGQAAHRGGGAGDRAGGARPRRVDLRGAPQERHDRGQGARRRPLRSVRPADPQVYLPRAAGGDVPARRRAVPLSDQNLFGGRRHVDGAAGTLAAQPARPLCAGSARDGRVRLPLPPARLRARVDKLDAVLARPVHAQGGVWRERHKVVGGRYVRGDVGAAVAARVRLHAPRGRGRAAARDVLHLPQRAVGGGGPAGRGAPRVPDDAGDARPGRVLSRPPASVPAPPARPPPRRLQLHRAAAAALARRRKQLGAAPARRPPPPRRAAQERATEPDARRAHRPAHADRVPRHVHLADGARDPHRLQEPERGRQASAGGVEGGGRHSLLARAPHAVLLGRRPLAAAPLRARAPEAALRARAARDPHVLRPAAAQRLRQRRHPPLPRPDADADPRQARRVALPAAARPPPPRVARVPAVGGRAVRAPEAPVAVAAVGRAARVADALGRLEPRDRLVRPSRDRLVRPSPRQVARAAGHRDALHAARAVPARAVPARAVRQPARRQGDVLAGVRAGGRPLVRRVAVRGGRDGAAQARLRPKGPGLRGGQPDAVPPRQPKAARLVALHARVDPPEVRGAGQEPLVVARRIPQPRRQPLHPRHRAAPVAPRGLAGRRRRQLVPRGRRLRHRAARVHCRRPRGDRGPVPRVGACGAAPAGL